MSDSDSWSPFPKDTSSHVNDVTSIDVVKKQQRNNWLVRTTLTLLLICSPFSSEHGHSIATLSTAISLGIIHLLGNDLSSKI